MKADNKQQVDIYQDVGQEWAWGGCGTGVGMGDVGQEWAWRHYLDVGVNTPGCGMGVGKGGIIWVWV